MSCTEKIASGVEGMICGGGNAIANGNKGMHINVRQYSKLAMVLWRGSVFCSLSLQSGNSSIEMGCFCLGTHSPIIYLGILG